MQRHRENVINQYFSAFTWHFIIIALFLFLSFFFFTSIKNSVNANSGGIYEWDYNGDGTITIIDYHGNQTDVIIPSEIEGMKVTVLSDEIFRNQKLRSAKLPDSLELIGGWAFAATELDSITIPHTVKNIGQSAFVRTHL